MTGDLCIRIANRDKQFRSDLQDERLKASGTFSSAAVEVCILLGCVQKGSSAKWCDSFHVCQESFFKVSENAVSVQLRYSEIWLRKKQKSKEC